VQQTGETMQSGYFFFGGTSIVVSFYFLRKARSQSKEQSPSNSGFASGLALFFGAAGAAMVYVAATA